MSFAGVSSAATTQPARRKAPPREPFSLPAPHARAGRRRSRGRRGGVCLMFGLLAGPAPAAVDSPGGWALFSVAGPLDGGSGSSPWRYWLDGQYRAVDVEGGLRQLVIRPGVGYRAGGTVLEAGWGAFPAAPDRGPRVTEQRLWQRATWTLAEPGAGRLVTRTWVEQRWRDDGDDVSWRVRQMLRLDWPVAVAGADRISLGVEPMVAVNDADWRGASGLDELWLFAGLGWRLAPEYRLEVAYLHQHIVRTGARDLENHLLTVGLAWRP